MSLSLFPWYCIGTVIGSLQGVKISMWIEKKLHAESDAHLKPKINVEDLQERIRELEQQWEFFEKYGYVKNSTIIK